MKTAEITASTATSDPWMKTAEAVAYLRTTQKSLYRRVSERRIRFTRDGGQLRFRRSWLDDYLRENESAPVVVMPRDHRGRDVR